MSELTPKIGQKVAIEVPKLKIRIEGTVVYRDVCKTTQGDEAVREFRLAGQLPDEMITQYGHWWYHRIRRGKLRKRKWWYIPRYEIYEAFVSILD